jgi:hypothetical protein
MSQTVEVRIPPNAKPGSTLHVDVNGAQVDFIIPPNGEPGQVLHLEVPAPVVVGTVYFSISILSARHVSEYFYCLLSDTTARTFTNHHSNARGGSPTNRRAAARYARYVRDRTLRIYLSSPLGFVVEFYGAKSVESGALRQSLPRVLVLLPIS